MMASNSDNVSSTPSFLIHTFTEKLLDTQVFFQAIAYDNGFFFWVGTSPTVFGDLAVAMNTKFGTVPSYSTLLGPSESQCNAIAQRLAKKSGKQVFVGGNLTYNQLMLPLVEKRIGQEMKDHPEVFNQ